MSWDDYFVAARWSDQKWGKESQLTEVVLSLGLFIVCAAVVSAGQSENCLAKELLASELHVDHDYLAAHNVIMYCLCSLFKQRSNEIVEFSMFFHLKSALGCITQQFILLVNSSSVNIPFVISVHLTSPFLCYDLSYSFLVLCMTSLNPP